MPVHYHQGMSLTMSVEDIIYMIKGGSAIKFTHCSGVESLEMIKKRLLFHEPVTITTLSNLVQLPFLAIF